MIFCDESRSGIGRVLLIEFRDQDIPVFDEVMEVLKSYQSFEHSSMEEISILSLPGFRIYPDRRKVYCGHKQIELTTKEFDILCLLISNKERVLTYDQIYEKLWNEEAFSNVNNTVGCQVRNLRRKLNKVMLNADFEIRCVRNVGYCLEIKTTNI